MNNHHSHHHRSVGSELSSSWIENASRHTFDVELERIRAQLTPTTASAVASAVDAKLLSADAATANAPAGLLADVAAQTGAGTIVERAGQAVDAVSEGAAGDIVLITSASSALKLRAGRWTACGF